jgi:hypothetical protein
VIVGHRVDLGRRDDRLVVAHLAVIVVGGGMQEGLTIAQALRLWVEDGSSMVTIDEGGEAWMRVDRLEWARGLSPDEVLPDLLETVGGKARRGRR